MTNIFGLNIYVNHLPSYLVWQDRLRQMREDSWLDNKSPANFDLKAITVGFLSNLEYCEQQTKFNILHPDTGDDDDLIVAGRESEEKITELKEAQIDQIIDRIAFGRYCQVKMAMFAEFEDQIIVGTPDTVIFYKSKPILLVEFKKSSSIQKVFGSEVLQTQIYRWLIEGMGFDCSKLHSILVKSNSKRNYEEEARKELQFIYSQAQMQSDTAKDYLQTMKRTVDRFRLDLHSHNKYQIHNVEYDKGEIENYLRNSLPFFLDSDYKITYHNQRNKCGSCIYNPRSYRYASKSPCVFMVERKKTTQNTLDGFF